MLAALNLDAHGIAAGLAGLLVERGAVGLDAVRAHLGAEAAALVEGLLRFDELRSFSAEDPAPAGRNTGAERGEGRSSGCAGCCSPWSTTCGS